MAGAAGSLIGSMAWSRWGWNGVCAVGGGLVLLAFLIWAGHRMTGKAE
ncbi:hypothetical protein LJK87_28910 [Paenibacillus sp. P25]|nr:hypothetical protein LJK87_28910 [Paenibacillus sp. P25]